MKKKSREHTRIIGALSEIRQKAREMEPKIEASNFLAFENARRDWSYKTFGPRTDRGPVGPLKHLEKEAREAYEEPDHLKRREELADCMFLVLDAFDREGMSFRQMTEELFSKLRKNQKREWPAVADQKPGQVVEHVRKPGEKAPTIPTGWDKGEAGTPIEKFAGFDRAAPGGDQTVYSLRTNQDGVQIKAYFEPVPGVTPETHLDCQYVYADNRPPVDCVIFPRADYENFVWYQTLASDAVKVLEVIAEPVEDADSNESNELEYIRAFARDNVERLDAQIGERIAKKITGPAGEFDEAKEAEARELSESLVKAAGTLVLIATLPDCGCSPCRGQCRDLEAENENMRDLANTFLQENAGLLATLTKETD